MDTSPSVAPTLLFVCEECRRPWLDQHERWRMYIDSDEPPRAVPYCPECASREFDGD